MREPLHYRLALSFVTRSALHPGSGEGRGASDAQVTLDGSGNPVLRASAIIGSIRHELARPGLFNGVQLLKIFGGIGDNDGPSIVSVDDSPISNVVFELRQGVGIDRVTGAAADTIKYDVSVIARGARFTVVLHADTDDRNRLLVEEIFATVIARAQAGMLRFGARTTRGFGALELIDREYAVVDDRRDFVKATMALARDVWPTGLAEPTNARNGVVPVLRFQLGWRVATATFSKSALSGNMAIPETAVVVDADAPTHSVSLLLAGSSAKGVLRSQGEYQVRTVCGDDVGVDSVGPLHFSNQIEVRGITELFGWVSDDDDATGHVAAVSIDDCYGHRRISQESWTRILRVAVDADHKTEGGMWPAMRKILDDEGLPVWRTMVHNRINEFTGGVVGKFLFSTLVPLHETFEPLRITVDLHRLPDGEREALLGLLVSILRDVRRGVIGFGFGTSKGFGQLLPGSEVTVALVDGESPPGVGLDAAPRDLFGDECRAWRAQLGSALSVWYDDAPVQEGAA